MFFSFAFAKVSNLEKPSKSIYKFGKTYYICILRNNISTPQLAKSLCLTKNILSTPRTF